MKMHKRMIVASIALLVLDHLLAELKMDARPPSPPAGFPGSVK